MNRNEAFVALAGCQTAAIDWLYCHLTALPQEEQNPLVIQYLAAERRRTRALLDMALARAQATGRKVASRQKAGV
jgi:hypothetical protein